MEEMKEKKMDSPKAEKAASEKPGAIYDTEWGHVSPDAYANKDDEWAGAPKKRNIKPVLVVIMIAMVVWYFVLIVLVRRMVLPSTIAMILGVPPIIIPAVVYLVLRSRHGGM